MTTISWIIECLLVKPTEGDKTDVVITAYWRCNGTDGTYNGTCYGSASFAPPTGSFTPYPDLQPEQVLDWCYQNGVDQTAIEANVTAQIEAQINPPVVVLPLPWVPPAPPAPVVVEEPVVVAEPEVVADAPTV